MGNKEQWRELLAGKTHYEAWKIIWGRNNLTSEQKKALYKYWEELHSEKQQQTFERWSDPTAWQTENKNIIDEKRPGGVQGRISL